jgi:hypothetical protein
LEELRKKAASEILLNPEKYSVSESGRFANAKNIVTEGMVSQDVIAAIALRYSINIRVRYDLGALNFITQTPPNVHHQYQYNTTNDLESDRTFCCS